MNNIYAQLELRFGLVRATTPKYTSYSYKSLANTSKDTSAPATAIRKVAKTAKVKTNVDVDAAARTGIATREQVVAKLNDWHDRKLIDLDAKGVVNIYRILKHLPSTAAEKQRIIDALYKELEVREQQELQRMEQVIGLITGKKCFALELSQHFGDSLPDQKHECGSCTWCKSKTPVQKVMQPEKAWDSKAFFAVLNACPDRDDPRFLARIAFGISSPRITQAKLSHHHVFGSMDGHDFMVRAPECWNERITERLIGTRSCVHQSL